MPRSTLVLTEDEIRSIQGLLASVAADISTVEDPDFHRNAELFAYELPRRVCRALHDLKLREPKSALAIVSGFPVDDTGIGPTPPHWKNKEGRSPTLELEVLLVLLGSLLGDCVGWATQQGGLIVHDLLPIRGHEGEQLGTGSEQTLWWHTEDAFHPLRGDYLGMACLRNPDRVATTFASLEDVRLPPDQWELLFEPHFTIRPDESHLPKNRPDPGDEQGEEDPLCSSYEQIERMRRAPEKIAILAGDPESPYIRIDPYFMDPADGPRAQAALDALIAAIEGTLDEVVLSPGDFCFLDNWKAVHGRQRFKARYDGTDRWLKRINLTRDLRKSRCRRPSAESRLIF